MNVSAPVVCVIDDDDGICESIGALVAAKGYAVKKYSSAEGFLAENVSPRGDGCLLLDFFLRGCDGLSFLKQYRNMPGAMPVVVLTAHADVPTAVEFMACGATTLLSKPCEPAKLMWAIDKSIDLDRRRKGIRQQIDSFHSVVSQLTRRQTLVLELVLDGSCNKSIASRLDVSERTIELDRAAILHAFGVKNAIELAVLVTKSQAAMELMESVPPRLSDEPVAAGGADSPHFISRLSVASHMRPGAPPTFG